MPTRFGQVFARKVRRRHQSSDHKAETRRSTTSETLSRRTQASHRAKRPCQIAGSPHLHVRKPSRSIWPRGTGTLVADVVDGYRHPSRDLLSRKLSTACWRVQAFSQAACSWVGCKAAASSTSFRRLVCLDHTDRSAHSVRRNNSTEDRSQLMIVPY